MDFQSNGNAWDSFVRSDQNTRAFKAEKLAAAAIADFLRIETTWIGASHGRDIQIRYPSGPIEVEVTQFLDERHKMVSNKIVSDIGYELIKDTRLTQSLFVLTTRDTHIDTLDTQAHFLAESMKSAGMREIHESDLWRLDTEYFRSQLSDYARNGLERFKQLKLQSARLIDGSGELIRIMPMVGGSFDGTSLEFDGWLERFTQEDLFEKKRSRISTQNEQPCELFVWLDPAREWAATQWLDHGGGTPQVQPDLPDAISALWVGVINLRPSLVRWDRQSWKAQHSNVYGAFNR